MLDWPETPWRQIVVGGAFSGEFLPLLLILPIFDSLVPSQTQIFKPVVKATLGFPLYTLLSQWGYP